MKCFKISVRVRGEWFLVPCSTPSNLTIRWLGKEALKRYEKLRPSSFVDGRREEIREIRQTRRGALLDPDDYIINALDNNDFVSVVLLSDTKSPICGAAEVTYAAEKIPDNWIDHQCDYIIIDGNNLETDDLMRLGNGKYKIRISNSAREAVVRGRELLESVLRENKVVYGINTGFGNFANKLIDQEDLQQLQVNLVRSHSAGVGQPLSPDRARRLLALRINVLAKGYSGISWETLSQLVDAFNKSCLSWVPEKGTVGASGDLAPLAHLALGLLGEGKMWSPESGWGEAAYVLETHDLKPIVLKPKEGIALLNGTQLITSLGAEAVESARRIALQADVIAALSLEVLKGSTRAFDADVHRVRPHRGQIDVAKRLRSLLHSEEYPSEVAESHRFCNRVQDAYTLRCCPQVHGIVHDTIDFVSQVITTEMNSATDNPLVFPDRSEIISGGNFHGEYPAKVLDYLTIAVHELSSMSERRIERLVNPTLSGLPAFLVENGGLNSGFMISHCTAAALVSENKVLCHPASVDSLSTSAATEDHVSMGGHAAIKSLQVIRNVYTVIAIELLAACQAIEFLRPLKTTQPLEQVYDVVRKVVRPWDQDRFMAPDIEAAISLLNENKIWEAVEPFIRSFQDDTQDEELRPASVTLSFSEEHLRMRSRAESPELELINLGSVSKKRSRDEADI